MIQHADINDEALRQLIGKRKIDLGGNSNLKIYGRLMCVSGERMQKKNRVFFVSEEEAIQQGSRPCGQLYKK